MFITKQSVDFARCQDLSDTYIIIVSFCTSYTVNYQNARNKDHVTYFNYFRK